MTTTDLENVYKESAALRNLDCLIKIQKLFNYFESKNISIQSRWIQHYNSSKANHEKNQNANSINGGKKAEFIKINS